MQFSNNAFSTLAAGITNVATSLTVASGQGARFPAVTAPDFFHLTLQDASNNIEIVRVTNRTAGSDTMTITRAQEGTTARAWALGDVAELRLTAFGLGPLSVFDGAATVQTMRDAMGVPSRTGGDASGTWSIAISGNAGTATALQTARNINGTSFNGSSDITTATWGTSRTVTIGATGKAVDGSAAVSWSLAEIGAAGVNQANTFIGAQTVRAAATQDGIQLAGRAGGTGSFSVTLSPGTLAASRTYTLPDVGGAADVVLTAGAQTIAGAKTFSTSPIVGTAAEKTADTAAASTAFVDRLRSLTTPTTGATGTLAAGDRGALVAATGGITVPASVFAARDVVTIFNNSAAAITITQGAGATLRQAGTTNTGNRTLAAYGIATVVFIDATTAVISGGGLT